MKIITENHLLHTKINGLQTIDFKVYICNVILCREVYRFWHVLLVLATSAWLIGNAARLSRPEDRQKNNNYF